MMYDCGTPDRALTSNSMKYRSPTPAAKFCWTCAAVSARLWMATNLMTPCHCRVPSISLPSTSAKVLSQLASEPPFCGIDVAGELAVDVELLAVDRIVGEHDVLQRRLRVHVGRGGLQRRRAVGARLVAARVALVLHRVLAERRIARRVAARVADDVGIGLRDVRRRGPRLDRVLAGGLDHVGELRAGGGGGLRLAARADVDAPAADPADVAR